jgi:hypothetical protein
MLRYALSPALCECAEVESVFVDLICCVGIHQIVEEKVVFRAA